MKPPIKDFPSTNAPIKSVEIQENAVYTPKETQELLKVSPSTMTRMLKKGLIRAAKVGKQYRILGKEILRVLSPKLEDQVGIAYNKARKWIHEGVDH
jgi:excisionase family DNA binding protein